jgi:hypothetical protein
MDHQPIAVDLFVNIGHAYGQIQLFALFIGASDPLDAVPIGEAGSRPSSWWRFETDVEAPWVGGPGGKLLRWVRLQGARSTAWRIVLRHPCRSDGAVDRLKLAKPSMGSAGDRRRRPPRLCFDLHVAMLQLPFIVLLEQDRANQPNDCGLVGKDAAGAALDFFVEPLERIGAVQLAAVLLGPSRVIPLIALGRLTGLEIVMERLEHVNCAAGGGSDQQAAPGHEQTR